MDKPISKSFILILFCLITFGYFFFQLNTHYEETEIKNHKIEVVGKVIKQYRTAKLHPKIRYEYSFEGKSYQNTLSIDRGSNNNYVNRYFKVNISARKPRYSIIFLDKEVIK
ncbi:hypothetical protein [uncultured Winogradskyella sp.]|uniref:hypothetical protein n=1 Tax=Winogradskyella sp. 4-2091 TaxID=3381659 RepID=UPI00261EFE9D|nr:hypothetical protein [uncultured Winogradskyella sp.]